MPYPAPEPLVTGPITMFVRRDDWRRAGALARRSRQGRCHCGGLHRQWLDQEEHRKRRGIKTEHASGTIGTVRMLLGGRGDVVIDMSSQIQLDPEDHAGSRLSSKLPTVIERVDWHLMISKRSPLVHDVMSFNEAIKVLKASPRYADTLRKYDIRA